MFSASRGGIPIQSAERERSSRCLYVCPIRAFNSRSRVPFLLSVRSSVRSYGPAAYFGLNRPRPYFSVHVASLHRNIQNELVPHVIVRALNFGRHKWRILYRCNAHKKHLPSFTTGGGEMLLTKKKQKSWNHSNPAGQRGAF